jgi:hypothetical protein
MLVSNSKFAGTMQLRLFIHATKLNIGQIYDDIYSIATVPQLSRPSVKPLLTRGLRTHNYMDLLGFASHLVVDRWGSFLLWRPEQITLSGDIHSGKAHLTSDYP